MERSNPLPSDHVKSMKLVLTLSERMLTSAQSEDWTEVMKLEKQRRDLIDGLELASADENAYAELEALFDKVLQINQELSQLGSIELGRCAEAMRDLTQGRKAVDAYKQQL